MCWRTLFLVQSYIGSILYLLADCIVCSFVLGSVYLGFHFVVGHNGDLLVGKSILSSFEQTMCS